MLKTWLIWDVKREGWVLGLGVTEYAELADRHTRSSAFKISTRSGHIRGHRGLWVPIYLPVPRKVGMLLQRNMHVSYRGRVGYAEASDD